ncbi:MAG: trypsin-like peptidase domain-containing protein [Armatimonadetes bacterium]|nr:trypsin-like peptidase domain-containing protein [Armatimonadota bacterium]
MRRVPILAIAVMATAAAALNLAPAGAQADVSPDVIERTIPATVKIWILNRKGEPGGGCSGSIVTRSGVILTASHCVRAPQADEKAGYKKGDLFHPEGLMVIGLNLPNSDLPVPSYFAKLIVDVPGLGVLDLAAAQIVASFDRGQMRPISGRLNLPVLRIGDSGRVRIGDRVAIFGFPGIGGATITVVKGNVVGFLPDARGRSRVFLKDDSMASPGHSGGPIINTAGEQIAVVSFGRSTEGAQIGFNPMTNFIPQAWKPHLQDAAGPAGPAPGPGPAPAPAAGRSILTGVIRDAATGQGIPNAAMFLFRPGINPRQATRGDIVASGTTDNAGRYRTNPPLPRGQTYPVAVIAEGYELVAGDVEVSPRDPDVIQMREVRLRRR